MKKIILLLFITSHLFGYAQKETAFWYFGDFAGLNFNSGSPTALTNSSMHSIEGCATISTADGQLLFYTNGETVWNKNHQVMLNGTGLFGHRSSTQSAIIIPNLRKKNKYYIITADKPNYYLTENDSINGINFSEVDMNNDGGLGSIVIKNQHLITYNINDPIENEFKSSEKLAAVLHNNGNSYWVLAHFTNKFYAFKIDENGVNTTPIISEVPKKINPIIDDDGINKSAIGYMKISPNGKKIAIAHSSTSLGGPRSGTRKNGQLYLYDFNDTSGIVSGEKLLLNNQYPYGVEFSAKSKKLYATSSIYNNNDEFQNSFLYQYNLEASNVINSRLTLNSSKNLSSALQLSLDLKIYRAGQIYKNSHSKISIIENPEESGLNCNYAHNSFETINNPTLGFPSFISSYFLFSYNYQNTCLGDETRFFLTSSGEFDSLLWDFGDGTTSTLTEPLHTYSTPGIYEVSLIRFIDGEACEPVTKNVIIYTKPNVINTTYELTQCDIDNNPTDGLSSFNLTLANAYISSENSNEIEVLYYDNLSILNSDTNNTNALNPIFNNSSRNQLLYAKVYKKGSNCYDVATIKLNAVEPSQFIMNDFYGCSFNDETGEFDLDKKKQEIILSLGLQPNTNVTFYQDEVSAQLNRNPIDTFTAYTSVKKNIYTRIEIDNACVGFGNFGLKFYEFPNINELTALNLCASDFPTTLKTEIETSIISNYTFEWNTGETSPKVQIQDEGTYSVIITDKNTYCSKTQTFKINKVVEPVINNIEIITTGSNFSIQVAVFPEGDYLYALETEDNFQESNIFENLNAGEYNVYVKDFSGCKTVREKIFILGFPNFFTPNNDGVNDTWQLTGLDNDKIKMSYIKIFDRFGKIIAVIDPKDEQGWSGLYQNEELPSSDYWFSTLLTNEMGETIVKKGHFSLIRR